MDSLAFVFPGQGSQSIGMMDALATAFPQVQERFGSASEILGFDLWRMATQGPEHDLNQTANTQPALLAASVATWDAWCACNGPRPTLLAGHSFGEYSALVCAGALSFEDAIPLTAARGRFMQEAVAAGEGGMAAIMGLELDALETICADVSAQHGVVSCANLNAPGQIVISGTAAAVDAACQAAGDAGAKRAIPLAVSAPAHSALMQSAAERLADMLATVTIKEPAIRVLHNADVASHDSADAIRETLVRQMTSPVRWIETIERFAAAGITDIVECGPGKVLSGLVRRIDRALACHATGDEAALRAAINTIEGEGT